MYLVPVEHILKHLVDKFKFSDCYGKVDKNKHFLLFPIFHFDLQFRRYTYIFEQCVANAENSFFYLLLWNGTFSSFFSFSDFSLGCTKGT
jgi:hypothetical protein